MRDTQRGSQSYMKKRRGRRYIKMSRKRKRGTQEERDRSMQYSVPYMFSIAQTPTEIHRIVLKREGGGRKYRRSEGENGESKVGDSNQHTIE